MRTLISPNRRLFASLVLALLLATTALVASFHYHDDGLDHDDCDTCAFVLHGSSGLSLSDAVTMVVPFAAFSLFLLSTVSILSLRRLVNILGRAPPFSSL